MSKRITKAQREQAKADEFRRIASSLLHLRHNDWNDWEYEWLHDEVRRRPLYIYTEREHEILDKLSVLSKSFTDFGGYTITELIAIAYPFRFDLDEDDQQFLEKLYGWRSTELRLRQTRRLARICRTFAGIHADPDELQTAPIQPA
jgi:hypothetical protein